MLVSFCFVVYQQSTLTLTLLNLAPITFVEVILLDIGNSYLGLPPPVNHVLFSAESNIKLKKINNKIKSVTNQPGSRFYFKLIS